MEDGAYNSHPSLKYATETWTKGTVHILCLRI